MVKVQIAVPRRDQDTLLRWLQDREVLHLTELAASTGSATDQVVTPFNVELAHVQFALEFIARIRIELHEQPRRSWRNIFAGRPAVDLEALEAVLARLNVPTQVQTIREMNDRLTDLVAAKRDAADTLAQLQPWRELTLHGSEMEGTAAVRHELVCVSVAELELFRTAVAAARTSAMEEIGRVMTKKNGTVYIQTVVHRSESALLDAAFAQTQAEAVKLPLPPDRTVTEHAAALEHTVQRLETEYHQLLEAARAALAMEQDLQFAYDALLHRQERRQAGRAGKVLPFSFLVEGWLPEERREHIIAAVTEAFPSAAIETAPAKAGEDPPVLLRNSRLVTPFEAVTNIFGKPRYTEIDPTPAMSLFFLAAFSMALTDAGYGAVMMVALWAAGRFFRLKREMRKMVRLLFYAGAATVVAGALTGGWFGISLETLPAGPIRDALLTLKLIDPVSSPMSLLLVAFALGIIQLLAAWVVRGYAHARAGDWLAMVFDDGAWITMVVLVLLWQASSRGLLLSAYTQLLAYAALANAGILVATQGRSYKNPLLKLGGGALSLYGLVSFLSDTLSYSRLLALGLATGVIALVVNLLGGMVAVVPYVGWILAATVLVVGHVFNLGINALGAFIHSGRLQFVEFFPKFLEGGGVPYRPLGRVGKYVDNPAEFD
ncbi:MAG: hypothetical protein COT71_04535 [Candidatus Andersenbacteria bacterium CG10_big_fil_rev_8_21_14_0_10_54_11]|uniref:Uncharacterized protein n=1 Tax=Candidatus Andersenbacteria bacterium CG10_big_fil_rev_8_21_14_0_10_54_11 TaxID=1974485 RepID=A0A2M6WY84_9BACT|nr:MAG: hypothetical protein COT71_04535 [Candidatus Andersenbacteria bacterium CG10_big_fil_rev_8_21_14_0_10_54_11]